MIRPLRQRHRRIICALAVILPVAFVTGVAARRTVPVTASIPSALDTEVKTFGELLWTKTDLWPEHRIITRLRAAANGSRALELMFDDLIGPDVLVYWKSGDTAITNKLPDDAQLLGALSNSKSLLIPAQAGRRSGRLILYSLANHEIVAISELFTL